MTTPLLSPTNLTPTSELLPIQSNPGPDTRTDIIPLSSHIIAQQQKHKDATGDLSQLLTSIAIACKWISNVVRKAELLKVLGLSGDTNIQAEAQQKLDVLSNQIMINMLRRSGKTCLMVSEELEDPIIVKGVRRGKYCLVFDPLDGSSNIDCGVSVGTIFGVYHVLESEVKEEEATIKSVLRPGTEMVAAGYCMYGSSTVLVFTTGEEVNGYTLDPNIGEFILTHKNMKIGSKKIFSLNEAQAHKFPPAISEYLSILKSPSTPYTARYVGSMVADLHRTLLYGGIFMYPSPKLRMLYEAFPMSMLVEVAGGKSSDGKQRVLEMTPKGIHDRTGIYIGSEDEVETIEKLFKKLDGKK